MEMLMRIKKMLIKGLDILLILAVAALVFDVVWGVFSRHILNAQTKWTEELARYLLIWVSLLGGAVAFGTKSHLGVDYFVSKLHPSSRKLMTLLGYAVVLFFAVAVFLVGGSRVVADAFAMEQMTPALGWKMGYVYLALPLAGFFITLFTLENIVETWMTSADKLAADQEVV